MTAIREKMAALANAMWVQPKEILSVIEASVVLKRSEIYAELDEVLTRNRSFFFNLLQNPVKNTSHREQVKKATTTGLKLDEQGTSITLKDKTVQDVLLLSDSLNLNEFSCVELMIAAEQQSPNFPGFSDSAIASLLYHDGRRSILSALKLLLTARPGITWTLELEDRMIELITKFTEELIANGLVAIILELLEDISLPNELQKLETARAVDDGKHKNLITELIAEQQQLLADCLFTAACQQPLNQSDCIKLMNYLKLVVPNTVDGCLDVITVRVLFALLVSFNCDVVDLAVENIEDPQYQQLPYFKDRSFLPEIHKAVLRPDTAHWQTPGLKYVIQFCWGIFLRACAVHPELVDFEEVFEEDDGILESAVTSDVFTFLRNSVIEMSKFHHEEYFVKFLHSFITSLIVKFPMKIKEWRNSGDENARILQVHLNEGMEPPQGLRHDFKDFMDVVGTLYKKDPLGLELNTEYWIPPEPMGGVFSPQPLRKYQQNIEQKKLMLNKFVRLAGDILLQTFYVSYINMLSSLSSNERSASYCFHLLSANALQERGGICAVSWEHFFNSIKQYYMSLRQTPDATDHRSHLHRHQEISPEELQGLESVLNLIKVVADKNENVRIAFCENENWLPVASLLGLVCCSIPSSLKGLLMETLAAFAKSPEIAASLWHSLEAAQLLQTHTSGINAQKSGMAAELLEIESRNEAYPQTRGFIKLVDNLTDVKVPPTLGAGYRTPGFHPYLQFLKDDVYLSFKTRAYQNANEKWQIGCDVMRIFLKILKEYTPQPEHFVDRVVEMQGINFGKAAKPSGFHLMSVFLKDTPTLRMTLSIIDDVAEQLKGFIPNDELRSVLEEISECCLSLLECVLEKQSTFIELARSHLASLILSSLDVLLLSVNPRTGKPDYLFIIGRYMTFANIKPSIPLSVVRIFKYVCAGSSTQRDIVDTLTQDEIASRELLVGFAEHLETPDPEVDEEIEAFDLEGDQESHENNLRNLIRQSIVQLLISTVNQPSVNLSQFLLGFDIRQPISRTNLQDPGVRGFPKTCLHSVVSILNHGIIRPENVEMLTPKLAELLYQLIYLLCAHPEMGNPIRRYLRTNQDFFLKHMQALPFLPNAEEPVNEIQYLRLANQQSWFLKAVAINLRLVAHSRMRSALQQLIGSLFNSQTAQEAQRMTTAAGDPYRTLETSRTALRDWSSRTMLGSAFTFGGDEKNLVLALLSTIHFTQRYPPNVDLQFFDYGAVEQLILSCEESDEMCVAMCNVRKLYRVLLNEINSSQLVVGATQKQDILKEVKTVLKHSVDRNLVRQSFQAKHNAFDAWRQVVEVIFAISPTDVMAVVKKQSILVEILRELIPKMTSEDALPELTSSVSGTILSLMANLWFAFTQIDGLRNTAEGSPVTMATVTSLFPQIIEGIISVGGSAPRMRANLYGAFLYYLQIGQMQSSVAKEGVTDGIFGKQTKESWETGTMEILNKYGESLLDIVAKDTCQGPCIARMMSMGVLDAIASLDWKHRYLMLMTSRGYLRVLIDQLIEDDVDLQNVLSLQPQTMKPLYLFESKMSFLARFASTDYGAQTLLQLGLISRLTECQFLDFHVEKPALLADSTMNYTASNDPFLPSLIERYSKIFTAFMRLLMSFLSSLGIHHQIATNQVQNLVMNHEDVFLTILQDASNIHTVNSLKQLSLTIAIISLLPITDKREDAWEILTDDQRHWRTFMNRIHRLMLTLLHKYSASTCKKILKQVLETEVVDASLTGGQSSHYSILAVETQNALLQIRSRVLTFCKNIISSQALSGPYTRVMFSASFTDNVSHENRLVTGKSVSSKQLPNLSLLVEELKNCPSQLTHCLEMVKTFERKMECVTDMNSEELREIISQEADSERLPLHQKQVVARKVLGKLKQLKENEANSLIYIIEHSIYILWRHIDYYYLHCVPNDDNDLEADFSRTYQRARKLTDSSITMATTNLGTTLGNNHSRFERTVRINTKREEITELKAEAPAILNGKLWQSILESDRLFGKKRSRLSFTPALVRRIQSIVQLNS